MQAVAEDPVGCDILTARDLSHGIQWQGRYYDELDRLDDKLLACATTTDVMLPPGL